MQPYRPIKTIRTDTTLDLSQKAEKSDQNNEVFLADTFCDVKFAKPQENTVKEMHQFIYALLK